MSLAFTRFSRVLQKFCILSRKPLFCSNLHFPHLQNHLYLQPLRTAFSVKTQGVFIEIALRNQQKRCAFPLKTRAVFTENAQPMQWVHGAVLRFQWKQISISPIYFVKTFYFFRHVFCKRSRIILPYSIFLLKIVEYQKKNPIFAKIVFHQNQQLWQTNDHSSDKLRSSAESFLLKP